MTLNELITDLKAAGANENTVKLAMNCYELGKAQPKREPLTDEQIEAIGDQVANMPLVGVVPNFRARLARAIEAAHGIKGAA